MSLNNFKNRTIIWDTVNKDFPQPIQIMQGDVNARTLSIKIVDNGGELDLTGHSLKLTYQYTNNSNSGFVMIPPKSLETGEFILVIPVEMTSTGVIDANLILLNEDKEQVIVSKNLTFISDNSTVTDLAQEVNNKIDDFTKLLLENMPQVMRSELNDLHAQTDSNTSNIELKANLADVMSLQNAMTNLQNEVEAFGITPENLVTIKSLLDAIASNASQSQVSELINSVNILTSNIALMSNGDYSPKANQTDLESLQQDINGKFNKLNNLPYTLTPNQYVIYNDGKTADIANTKFFVSSYVNVSSIDVLTINTKFSGYGDGYAFYDVNKVYISGSNVYTTTINVPANAVYFRFSAYNIDTNLVTLTGTNSLNFIKEQISTINKQIQPPTNYYYGIGKTLMIGDSLTSGAYYDDVAFKGASINQNIPFYLGKITNNAVKNAGVSGSTPISWHSTEFTKYDYTQFDTFFIWFGTNQGLTDTIENDVNAHASYNDYATTNTGTYCKLIEEIKAVNPDSSIHLSTVFASSGNIATTNSVINQIATKYDLNIIDMSDLSTAKYPNLHLGINNTHFGKSGNIYVANRIANDLNSYFASNQLKLEFGLTPRTD